MSDNLWQFSEADTSLAWMPLEEHRGLKPAFSQPRRVAIRATLSHIPKNALAHVPQQWLGGWLGGGGQGQIISIIGGWWRYLVMHVFWALFKVSAASQRVAHPKKPRDAELDISRTLPSKHQKRG